MVIFFEESIVFNCPLLELHIYAAAVDADDAPDATAGGRVMERRRSSLGDSQEHDHCLHFPLCDNGVSYSTFSLIRVLSFIVAVRAKPLVDGDDMWDCRTVSKTSRTSSSVT